MIEDLAAGLRRVRAANPSALTGSGTNSYLIGQGKSVALIDPGPNLAQHRQALLDALSPGQQISHVFVTHPHKDHSALAHALARETGAELLAFGTAQDGISPRMTALADAGSLVSGEGADLSFRPDRRLSHGQRVSADSWQIEALHTPGHMGSHLCFAWNDVLFSGDHVMGWSTSLVAPPEGDMRDYMASLSLLASRTWSVFLPGHGEPVTNPERRLEELTRHRRAREAAILDALAAPSASATGAARVSARSMHSAAELARSVYTTTPPHLLGAAERNVLAHLIDLVDRGLVKASAPPGPETLFSIIRS